MSHKELIHAFNVNDSHAEHPFKVSFFNEKITCPSCRALKEIVKGKERCKLNESIQQMKIDFIEIKNFRKLKECRIDFNSQETLLVGANNSGKTSAVVALRKTLLSPNDLELRDISIGNWAIINTIGSTWEQSNEPEIHLNDCLPSLDIWLNVPLTQIHHIVHILPSIDWNGGAVGVRLQYEIKNLDALKADFLNARRKSKEIEAGSKDEPKPSIEPTNLVGFLQTGLAAYIELKSYSLNTEKINEPDTKGNAIIQRLDDDAIALEGTPFKGLINIREIPALRDFSENNSSPFDGKNAKSERVSSSLSGHVRGYYEQHINNSDDINSDDINAFGALQKAEEAFDKRLEAGFSTVLRELEELGVPGVNNPDIVINAKFKSIEGLNHDSAVQYRVSEHLDEKNQHFLPESYAGLGYQNLIAMVFLLMRFRQDWIEPKQSGDGNVEVIEPLQLIMIEEPEAHLHAQIQQVFIKKAYTVLQNHPKLKSPSQYSSQLLISTHSSHIAHEVDFSNLRYFRRLDSEIKGEPPVSTVVNLSKVYGKDDKTYRFVKRYIKATDCDLFFADGAIFVEGQSERILVPHFIRNHFEGLWKRYISIIDLGGSNAPRFEPLIKALGLTSLVITDLDAGIKTLIVDKNGKNNTVTKKAKPAEKENQVTTNPTLKKWHPKLTDIDELLSVDSKGHSVRIDDEYDLFVAYQKKVIDPTNEKNTIIPRTFEDALVYANFETLKEIEGSPTTNKIADLVSAAAKLSGSELESELFDIVNSAEKAAFAIDCLMASEDDTPLSPPSYIASGLKWMEEMLQESKTVTQNTKEA
jgi:predicted ATP-dependent endonuclease of OLD family